MKKIKFEMKFETTYKGQVSLDDLLDYADITEAEWDALTTDEKENLMCNYYEDEFFDMMTSYDTMDYCLKIKN